ncbi:nitroreductase family protein [Microbacterium sp. X-17]|uniref:nitroreductase family protein n=1 Tax=Microbacterium sp. X-17 TaxID=3144404 RepID=UPI0031F4A26A
MSELEAYRNLRLAATQSASDNMSRPSRSVEVDSALAADLVAALPSRRSVKYYLPEPISVDWLGGIQPTLQSIDQQLSGGRAALRFICAFSNIEGRTPGLYELGTDGWAQMSVPLESSDLRTMTLQPEFGDAALIVVLVGSLVDAVEHEGPNGHRQLLQRAGAIAEVVWLAAVSEGYAASIFAGFLPAELKSRLGFDGIDSLQLIAIAIGMEDAERLARAEREAMGALG